MTNWLAARIAAEGPMPVEAFMRACLMDDTHGYYRQRQAIGAAGDFITAPEISQIFGELIGIWVAVCWQSLGEPTRWRLIELGPGRGTLMADALRALKVLPVARGGLEVVLVESNVRLRDQQRARLADCGVPVGWRENVGVASPLPSIVIANEFLDALPIRQLVAVNGHWHERLVGVWAAQQDPAPRPDPLLESTGRGSIAPGGWLPGGAAPGASKNSAPSPRFDAERGGVSGGNESGTNSRGAGQQALCFIVSESPIVEALFSPPPQPDGAFCEVMTGAADMLGGLACSLAGAPHMHLYIDYGHLGPVAGDTLQAVSAQRYADPLAAPGEHDLSAQVDFAQVAGAAKTAGLTAYGPITQAELLGRLGAAARLQRLTQGKDARTMQQLQSGLARLMDPSGMGARFRAMALTSEALAAPPVF